MRNMKRNLVYILVIIILAVLCSISTFKYLEVKKEKQNLQQLLKKASLSIDRDNQNIHEDINEIISLSSSPELQAQKKYFDSLLEISEIKKHGRSEDNLSQFVEAKITFTDTLLSYRRKWSGPHINFDNFFIIEVLEHAPVYKYGDTAKLYFQIVGTLGFLKDNYEIVEFSPSELGSKVRNNLNFQIPTRKLFPTLLVSKEYNFEYKVMLRNNHTNLIDTLYLSKSFLVNP